MHFWGLTHECRGRVEVNLQEIAETLFGAGGGTLVHTHFSLREISKTADRGGAGHPWARFPRCALTPLLWAVNDTEVQLLPIAALSGTRARDAGRQGPRRFLPAAGAGAGAGRWCRALVLVLVLVLVLWCWCWCWCWCCGAGAVVLVLVLVLVLVPALWCWVLPAAWRAQFPCTRIGCIPHEVQGHTRTRAGRATYAARAGSQTTGCSRP